MMDLSHLSHAEKLQIIRVLKRDEKLLKTETNRVLRLKHEVQDLKRRSAVKAGENDRVCVRCHSELGLIINTGAECFKCHFMVCKNCRVVVTEDGKTWLCILCAKQAKLRTISGEWFYEKVSDRLKPSVSSYVHGSNFVRDSLRLKNRNSRDTGVVPFTSNSSGNSPVATKRGGFPSHQPDVLAILKSRALSASGITSREGSAINLDGDSDSSGKERDPGERPEKTALDSDGNPEWSRSRLCAEIQRGFAGSDSISANNDAVFSGDEWDFKAPDNHLSANNSSSLTASAHTNLPSSLGVSSPQPHSQPECSSISNQLTSSLPNYSLASLSAKKSTTVAQQLPGSHRAYFPNSQLSSSRAELKPNTSVNVTKSQESISSESSSTTIGSVNGAGGVRSKTSTRSSTTSGHSGCINSRKPPGVQNSAANQSPAHHMNTATSSTSPSSTMPLYCESIGGGAGLVQTHQSTQQLLQPPFTGTEPAQPASYFRMGKQSSPSLVSSSTHLYSPHHPAPSEFRKGPPMRETGRGYMVAPFDYPDQYAMPYLHPGLRTPMMPPHYMESGSLHRQRRAMSHGVGPRYPLGYYPIDNTHKLIMYKVELLNKNIRCKYLSQNQPPSQAHTNDEQFGAYSLQEYVSPDNSEHAATLSSESERSHRSHHVDDDLDETQRRADRSSLHKQNSSDNYEHEQSNRRSSLQGANSEDSANDSGANAHNTTGASTNITGSNSSLQASMPGLELGSRHPGYSCSVPATPEHRRHLATSEWAPAGHPGVPYPTRGVPLGDAYSMGRGRRGIPYAYRSHGPRMGGAAAANARVPFRHPSQYRSLPTHGYGFYPRVRGRPMTPVHASSRFSSQEDFRGSSKSLAVYPSSGDYRSPDMRMMRGRVGGSRESLDSQAMQQASRESRSLNKSYPVDNRQGRSTSLPPTEDRLGEEDEAVLSRLAADPLLSSNHVPSFIRSLTPPGTATDRGGQTPPHTITAEGGVSPYLPHYQQGDTPQTENKAVERKEKQRKRSTSLTHKFSSALHSLSGSLKTGKREVTTSQSSLSRPPSSDPATDLASSGLEARSSLDTISQTDWGGSLKWKKSLSGSQTSLGSLGSIKDQLRKNSRRFRSHIDKEGGGKEKAPSKKSVSVVDRGKEVVHMFIQNEDKMVASSTENKFLLGCVQFSFDYDIKKARLNLRNLSFASLNSTGNKLCTPYAKLTLKSTNGKISKVKTKVSKPTTDVCFDEQLQFPVAETDINSASLRISAWNKTSIGKDTLMGEVEVNLSNWKNWQGSIERFPLTIYALNDNKSGSSVKLTVKFVPKESIDIRIAVSSLSKKGFNEPNTMCKLHLLPLTKSYKTQEVRGCDPVYLQTFSIPINSHSLSDFCLELAIFSLGLHAHSKSFIGGVRLSDGTAVCRGALVEWMQSTGEEIEMWQKIQNMSGQWVQVRLPLRSNFSPLK